MILVSCVCVLSLWWRWISSVLVIIRIDDLPPITVHCVPKVCVCLNYVIWANLLDSAQKFIMCPKSTFLVGARNHAKRQWILKSGIFTKKTGGGIWPTWYLSHYSITPGRYFSIGQIYWSKYLVWTAVICRDLFFKIKDLFVLHIEKLVMNGPSQRSLTLMQ